MDNKDLYNTEQSSGIFYKLDYLEEAEAVILEKLRDKLRDMNMLDIGVGGGRTTKYFAPLVKNYVGIDYAPAMVKRCKDKFEGKLNFIECDVRRLNFFKDNYFDFILFSFNGLDDITHMDRLLALEQINRVLKKDGYFCFSSHNLRWEKLHGRYKLNFEDIKSANPIKYGCILAKRIYNFLILRILNRSFFMSRLLKTLRKNGHGYLQDEICGKIGGVYLINYHEQLKQLISSGFGDIVMYSRKGVETNSGAELDSEPWIYYLCKSGKII